MSRWLICIVAMLLAGPATAADVTALQVVEVGLFRAVTTGEMPSPQAVNERTALLDNVVFYNLTTKVPARLGIRFGTRFRVVGAPANQTVMLRSIWRIPEPGIQKPETGKFYRESIADNENVIGGLSMRGYTFDDYWEIRCGEWLQEVWFGDRKLLSQTFTVEDCQGVPSAARGMARPAG
ncbi:MAG: DUF3859 domain-containing protein [Alphaproteobacteria bacterium]|nr:DUF3859 domain-containing protein [Alphaproteobacteria bacterium]